MRIDRAFAVISQELAAVVSQVRISQALFSNAPPSGYRPILSPNHDIPSRPRKGCALLHSVAPLRVRARSSVRHLGCVITRNQKENTMTKLLKKIRSVLRSLGHKAKLSLSVALSIPGFLKIEVEYEKTLTPPDKPDAA